jgi:hypothetical protein
MTSSLSYPLTKFRYFTQLLTTTPICVVSEIANSCGYRVDGEKLLIPSFLAKVTQLCYNAAVVEYPHDVTEENGSAIAIFINNDFPWPIEDLQLAYDFVRRGTDIDFKAYAAGYPTPSHPERILPSICYAAMLERKFTTTQHMSLLEMYNILTTSMIDKQQYILSHLNALTEEGLNMMYGYSLQASTIITYNPEDVYKHSAAKSLPTMSYDAATAVAIAARTYAVDISSSVDPSNELMALLLGTFPRSKRMQTLRRWKEGIFHVTCFFNPMFAIEVYKGKPDWLRRLSNKYNIKYDNDIDAYNNLRVKFDIRTFHLSLVPSLTNFESCVNLDNITELHASTILFSYGRGYDYVIYQLDELEGYFDNYADIQQSEDEGVSQIAVIDLMRLLESGNKMYTQEQREKCASLLIKVKALYQQLTNIAVHRERASNFYNKLDQAGKERYVQCCRVLFELSLYMRGWKGDDEMPLQKLPGIPEGDRMIAAENYQKHYDTTFDCIEGRFIHTLAIVRHTSGKYEVSISYDEGATIHDRVIIMRKGYALKSCIGMSANWLLSSAHFYAQVAGVMLCKIEGIEISG